LIESYSLCKKKNINNDYKAALEFFKDWQVSLLIFW
jgi:hypothetical protein